MAHRYLLDTNVLSEVMRPAPAPSVLNRILAAGDTAVTCAPVWHELEYGRARVPTGRRRRALDILIDGLAGVLVALPYDQAAAVWHARERARLEKMGETAPFIDDQIAAISAVHGLVLVTRNVRDFARFGGLRVESWFEDGG